MLIYIMNLKIVFYLGFWLSLSSFWNTSKEFINRFALWNTKLKKVEGVFGSSVYNYFKFLKWAMGLNLFMTVLTVMLISVPEHYNDEEVAMCNVTDYQNMTMFPPESLDQCCTSLYILNQEWKRDPLDVSFTSFSAFAEDVGYVLLNLFQGDG